MSYTLGWLPGEPFKSAWPWPGALGLQMASLSPKPQPRGPTRVVSWSCSTGAERYFLQHLPVSLLPLAEEGQRQLRLLGIQTLEQYTALPHDAVQSRFGGPGRESWRWARGIDSRPPLRCQQERCLLSTVYFDDPVREQPTLERAVGRLLTPLCDTLQREGLGCQELDLTAELEKGPVAEKSYVLREPTANSDRLQAIALELLAQLPWALQGLTLKLGQLTRLEAGRQLDLFVDRQMAAELDSTLIALATRYGEDCFQRARTVSPDALLPERRFAFEQFRMAP